MVENEISERTYVLQDKKVRIVLSENDVRAIAGKRKLWDTGKMFGGWLWSMVVLGVLAIVFALIFKQQLIGTLLAVLTFVDFVVVWWQLHQRLEDPSIEEFVNHWQKTGELYNEEWRYHVNKG